MSDNESARDPYVGLNRHISDRAQREMSPSYTIGEVLSLQPIKIRVDGLDLETEDLFVPESIYPNFAEGEGDGRGIQTRLPQKAFMCSCGGVVIREEEFVYGRAILSKGDTVLLMRSGDGQTYYLIERMVRCDPVSAAE